MIRYCTYIIDNFFPLYNYSFCVIVSFTCFSGKVRKIKERASSEKPVEGAKGNDTHTHTHCQMISYCSHHREHEWLRLARGQQDIDSQLCVSGRREEKEEEEGQDQGGSN